jgi:GTP cyclohydrolase II
VDANHALGFSDELRSYGCVPNILADLGVTSVKLLTNNPFKVGLGPTAR